MRQALVFGGSGQIGAALLPRLGADGWQVVAVSRQQQRDSASLRWLRGDLAHCPGIPDAVDAIFSCGP
ncbi:MAG: NAD-dependent epimerase/dehydratase family protein, partial [Luteimonas sp.]